MANAPTRVLLVDEDEGIYAMVRQWADHVEGVAFNIQWVSDYDEALYAVLRREHDVYLFDATQEGPRSGLDLLREAIEQGFQSPIIMLTGRGARVIDIEAMKLGVTDYLDKEEVTPSMLARSIRFAVERARTAEEMAYAATHDLLTGLFNRQYTLERLAAEAHSCERYGYGLSFCLCDIDGFKDVNDSHGHRAGDEVLCRFAKLMLKYLRPEDLAGRYGGDEMCIVFPHTNGAEARTAVERLRKRLLEEAFEAGSGERFTATASFGIAERSETVSEEKGMFEAADKALYAAKHAGRNRTVIHAPDM